MAIQDISLGSSPTGVGGDTHRDAWTKANANFDDLDLATVQLVTAIYTFVEGDNRKVFVVNSGSFAFRVPDGLSAGWSATVLNYGGGVISFTAVSSATFDPTGVTLNNSGGADMTAATLLHAGSNAYKVVGPAPETVCFIIALSDETTALTTGTGKATFRAPFAFTLTGVRASVTTAPVGDTIEVDINESGTTVLSTILSIDAGEKTSYTAATPAVISDTAIADDAELTFDIDQIGSSTAGAGLKVMLLGYRS